jgi:hypothetical protein
MQPFYLSKDQKDMKASKIILILVALFLALGSQAQRGKWQLLGERTVTDRLDHDVIRVTVAKGDFKAIQIRVKGASVDFHKVIVIYGNGMRQEIELRHTIPSGGSSRVIDLAGHDRHIREIECWYDANTIKGRKALVRIWGRH